MAAQTAKKQDFASLPVGGKIVVLLVLLMVFSAVYYFALHHALTDDIAAAQTRKQQLETDLRTAQQRQTRYRELAQEIAVREAQDRQNQRVLPEQAEMSAFLQDIDRIAELSGLSVQVVEPRPEEPQDLYVRLPVTLQLRGRYHQIAKFFYNVSNLERAINMENLVLAEPESENDEVQLSVNVLATTFRRIGDEPVGEALSEGESG